MQLRGRSGSEPRGFKRFVDGIRSLDRNLVKYGSWIVGTRYRTTWRRVLVFLAFFGGVAIGGATLPWPWCLWILSLGLFAVFIVFRDWSTIENAVEYDVSSGAASTKIDIDRNINPEMLGACAFVFVFAPVAFAQIQMAGFGFELETGAGPFAFVRYTMVELLKIGPLVQYYDVFAERLQFETLVAVSHPTMAAKAALLVFRGTVDLIILAALKRFVDIAQRVAAGLDLRPHVDALRTADEKKHGTTVRTLEAFALDGRARAMELLQDILKQPGDRSFIPTEMVYSPDVRFAAANALSLFGHRRRDSLVLWFVIDNGYLPITENEWTRESHPMNWARAQEKLGDAYQSLGMRETVLDRMRRSQAAYKRAMSIYEDLQIQREQDMQREMDKCQSSLAETERVLAERAVNAVEGGVLIDRRSPRSADRRRSS
jgi:hypothetical protein